MSQISTLVPAPAAQGRRPRPGPVRPNVIAVASGKGGVGKTWFAITLAHAFARQGDRVLLFDGDLGLANVDIQLGLMPRADLGSVIANRTTLRQSVTTFGDGGFDIIAGRSGTGSLSRLPAARLEALCDDLMVLSGDYDRVVLDLGAGIEGTVRALTAEAGTIVVLATNEPTALTDAYAFIKVTAAQRPDTDFRIVINMAASPREGERTYGTLLKACQNFLKLSPPLAGSVRRDPKVAESIRNQACVLSRHPNSDAAADVEAIARRLMEKP